MFNITNDAWILANTFDFNLWRFVLTDPLAFDYKNVWRFKDSKVFIDKYGAAVGSWENAPNQPQNGHLIVNVKTESGESSIEFINNDFGVYYSAGQIIYFLAREHAFHPEWTQKT